jgi:type III restriction enzyme
MIVVCDNTEIAELVFTRISGEKVVEVPKEGGEGTVEKVVYEGSEKFPLFANTATAGHTVRIDSKLLAKIETEEGETRDEAAQALREIIDTVGKRGGPGEQVRCVVSVSMLTEGWDASNVTHILGIRAFGSQLLCEQVVGRGLRRMDYRPDPETGKLSAEYVDVYGIPFSLIPFKGRAKDKDPVDVVYHHVFAVPERKHLEIRMPVVESYTYDVRRSGISCDVDSLEGFVVDDEPTKVYVMETRGYQDQIVSASTGNAQAHTREEFYSQVRFQHVAFWLAQLITDDLIGGARGKGAEELKKSLLARHQLFPEIVRIVQLFVDKKVTFANDVDRRELALEKYATLLRERVRDGIVAAAATEDAPLLPIVNSYKPFASTSDANFRTARPVVALSRSHLNFAVLHSGWEKDAVEILEDMDGVEAYSPNDRNVGFTVPYEYLGSPARYEPDFVVRMRGVEPGKGRLVLLEIKGRGGEFRDEDRVLAKNAAAKKWVDAVNNARRFSRWEFEICRDLAGLRATLAKYDEGTADVIPFRMVDNPKPEDQFRTCVPLSTLRAAAGLFSEEQASLEFGEDTEWVTFHAKTVFEHGMFVARVQGRSMEPEIPGGSYCLFRLPRGGTRQGKRLLVRHSGIADPDTGGQYTLKVFKSEKVAVDGEDWRHDRIVLEPLNPAYEPIVLEPRDEGDVGVIAEFVEVVGA